jgi:carbonic anhydrase
VSLREELLAANAEFAAGFSGRGLPRPPACSLAVVTCLDGRIDPLPLLGLRPGDANVLRNAGARVTDDVLRSLVVSRHLLGMRETMLIGHTDCGLEGVTNADVHEAVPGSDGIDFLPFADLEESVREGVRRIRATPLLADVEASGWIYDVETGRLGEVSSPR